MITFKNLLAEGAKENAALDYLQKLVQSGPFKGRVYLAGGAVRDMQLGKDPKDLDVVVTGGLDAGMEFAKYATQTMNNYSNGSNPVLFPTYGTAKFTLKGITHNGFDLSDVDIEAVATRKEKYTTGSRKPEVSAGDLADDVHRRDFTVNSLLKDLTTGEILDLTGKGKEDIRRGIIQTPLNPDVIFTEDPLRMLRAVRFTMKYGWELPMFMIRALKRNAAQLRNISAERIRDELDKTLVTGSPDRAIKLLRITGLLNYIIPEFKSAYKMTQNAHHDETVFNHILTVVKNTKPNLITRLQALFHDIGKTTTRTIINNEVHFYDHENVSAVMTRAIMSRLKYPNDVIDAVVTGVRNHMRLKPAGKQGDKMSDKSLRKFIVDLGGHLDYTLDLMHADNVAHAPESAMPEQIPNIIKRIEILKTTTPKKNEKLPITGEDLIKLGLNPSPLFSKLLDLVKDKQLENPNTTNEEYLDLIQKYLTNV